MAGCMVLFCTPSGLRSKYVDLKEVNGRVVETDRDAISFLCRIFARSVGDHCRLCDFRIPVQYNHPAQCAFPSSPDFSVIL